MVKEIQAFAADDGSIHTSFYAAARADAYAALSKLNVFNHASNNAVLDNAEVLLPVLQTLVEAKRATQTAEG